MALLSFVESSPRA
jgi:serine/threonine-protein kinase HipA